MKTKTTKTVLTNRQFTGLLLVLFCVAALIIKLWPSDADTSWQAMSARMDSEALMVQTFGFLLPPLHSLVLPLLVVIAFLALAFGWLSINKESKR